MVDFPTLDDLYASPIKGKRIILRTCFNAAIEGNTIVNAFRIDASLCTIDELLLKGAHILAVSHRSGDTTLSLAPVVEYLKERGYQPKLAATLEEANILLQGYPFVVLENVRKDPREETASIDYAKAIAALGEAFVVDDFSVLHREHATVTVLPTLLPSYAGRRVIKEVDMLSKAINPATPAYAVFGGGKFGTKTPLISNCLESYDAVFVAGALMNDFFVAKGYDVGTSRVSKEPVSAMVNHQKLVLPTAVSVRSSEHVRVVSPDSVNPDEAIVDVAPEGMAMFLARVKDAKTILWNGPLGFYELGSIEGTKALADALLASSAELIVGGGDTVSALSELGLQQRFPYLSTGGGAMLAFVLNGTLPGLDVLKHSSI